MIFVDTSFWVALRNVKDGKHQVAVELLQQQSDIPLLTTNHVVGETWTFLRRRAGHASAVDFVEMVTGSPRVEIIHVSEELETQALEWLRQHDEREYSYVDATSFTAMKSLRIQDAFAFDGDFTAAGHVELRP